MRTKSCSRHDLGAAVRAGVWGGDQFLAAAEAKLCARGIFCAAFRAFHRFLLLSDSKLRYGETANAGESHSVSRKLICLSIGKEKIYGIISVKGRKRLSKK
jgi:hypothetical protein